MPEVKVLFNIKEEPSKESVHEELNWYDTIRQEMLVFYGGKLTFKYKEDDYLVKMGQAERQRRGIRSTYRMLPEVEELVVNNHFKMKKMTNKKEIEKWFYSSVYASEVFVDGITDDSVTFDVPEEQINDFSDDLDRQGFRLDD